MLFRKPLVFAWDKGNNRKTWERHAISLEEAEEPFFDEKKKIAKDIFHSSNEERFILLGKTKKGILLFIVFTIRSHIVRVISARKVNKKEVLLYEKTA